MRTPPVDLALGAALGTALLALTVVGIYFYRKSIADAHRFVTVTARGYRQRTIDLGWRRYLVTVVLILYAFLAVVLPFAALIFISLTPYGMTDFSRPITFSLTNFTSVAQSATVMTAIRNTLTLGVFAPTACVLLGLLVAFLVQRRKSRLTAAIDYVSTFPIAIPGIVFGTGMLWVYVRTPLYATLTVLFIAYVASYLPHTARLAGNGLLQIDSALEEASAVTGSSTFKTLRRITFPLAKPALFSAWALAFIFTTREINTAIILYSARSRVLSTMTWDYIETGNVRNAAVVGLIQSALLLFGVVFARVVLRVKVTSSSAV